MDDRLDDRPLGTPGFDPDRWLAEHRSDEERAARVRRTSLASQLAETATWVGTLVDLAETGDVVAVGIAGGRIHRARIEAVGRDVVVLAPVSGVGRVLARLASVAWVRTDGRDHRSTGNREPGPFDLTHLLGDLLDDRPLVQVNLLGLDDALRGRLSTVGLDIITLTDDAGRTVALPVDAVADVTIVG